MPQRISWITEALAPGIALSAIIFFNTSLQNRFVYVTGRIRDLTREARALHAGGERGSPRLQSIWRQVTVMSHRAGYIRRSVLTLYAGLLSFILTIVLLATGSRLFSSDMSVAPFVAFLLGFACFISAGILSIIEMYMARFTIHDDIRSSFPDGPPELERRRYDRAEMEEAARVEH